jgi:hypothetical protein
MAEEVIDREKHLAEVKAMRIENLKKHQYRGGGKPQNKENRKARTLRYTDEEYEVIKILSKILKRNGEKANMLRMIAGEEKELQSFREAEANEA